MPYHQTASERLRAEYAAKLMTRTVGGDVIGPNGATANDLAAFDGTTGKVIKDSAILVSDVQALIDAAANQYYLHTGDVLDDGTFNLPAIANGARGVLVVGADEERADFSVKSDGTVNLIMASANVVANVDTDGKFCVGTSVASPCVIKNRLGGTKAVMLQAGYN